MGHQILLDRSRIVARQECEMLRYLNYHWGGTGLEPISKPLALDVGIAVHKGVEELFRGQTVADAVDAALEGVRSGLGDAPDFYLNEQSTLVEGLIRGWAAVRLPLLMEDYRVAATEQEMVVPLGDGLELMVRFDAMLQRKSDGQLVIWDAKTLSYVSDSWMKVHEHSLQTVLYTWAAAQLWGEPVAIMYEGMVKGARRMDMAKSSPFFEQVIQQSLLCYGYRLLTPEQIAYYSAEYPNGKKGWEKFAAWQHHEGVVGWVRFLQQAGKLEGLFPVIPPILPTTDDQLNIVHMVKQREASFDLKLDDFCDAIGGDLGGAPDLYRASIEPRTFEQNRGRCFKYGVDNQCAFVDYCYNKTVAVEPLEVGIYKRRQPHHASEVQNDVDNP